MTETERILCEVRQGYTYRTKDMDDANLMYENAKKCGIKVVVRQVGSEFLVELDTMVIKFHDEPILTDVVIEEDKSLEGFEFSDGVVDRYGRSQMGKKVTEEILEAERVWDLIKGHLVDLVLSDLEIEKTVKDSYAVFRIYMKDLNGSFGSYVDFCELVDSLKEYEQRLAKLVQNIK